MHIRARTHPLNPPVVFRPAFRRAVIRRNSDEFPEFFGAGEPISMKFTLLFSPLPAVTSGFNLVRPAAAWGKKC